MARQVFFSFHYTNDIFRVNTVRNHWITKANGLEAGYWDHSLWEKTKLRGKQALKDLIEEGLKGSSVTVVLIGNQTAGREWVNWEIKRSHERGMGMIGVYIHQIRCAQTQRVDAKGRNPFDDWSFQQGGRKTMFSEVYPTYDWVSNDGYNNFASWVERAAIKAGR